MFLTRGAHGIVVATHDEVAQVLPVDTGPDVDPVGAGDVATAAIAAVLGSGGDAREAGDLANLAASVSVRVLRATGASQIVPEAVLAARGDDIVYAPGLADDPTLAAFVDGAEIEVVDPSALSSGARLQHVIFDHDGTLSTLREGWEAVMAPMMVRAVLGPAFGTTGPSVVADVRREVDDLIDRTTGIQTLVQMKGLVELVRKWNFVPDADVLDEHGYKAIYNDLLLVRVRRRLAKVRSGQLAPEDFHIKNAVPLLSALRDAGLTLHLASGTDEADVVAEANERVRRVLRRSYPRFDRRGRSRRQEGRDRADHRLERPRRRADRRHRRRAGRDAPDAQARRAGHRSVQRRGPALRVQRGQAPSADPWRGTAAACRTSATFGCCCGCWASVR